MSGRLALPAALIAATLAGCATAPAPPDRIASNWPGFGGSSDETHFSALQQIDPRTISRLGLAWSVDLPAGNPVSAPVAVDGRLYVATGYSFVQALDAATGKQIWSYDADVAGAPSGPRKMRYGWGIRGLAHSEGRIFVGTQDGRLVALSASDGRVEWTAETLDSNDDSFISGAPRVGGGMVFIGQGGADSGKSRGYVTAYDAATGKQVWRFHTVPGNPADGFESAAMAMAAKTWSGEWWKFGGGGTVWNAMTYDEETGTLFLGTGNGTPWNQRIRSPGGGDNLFLCSIVALDAKTGTYKWHYQINPGETWDYNAAMDMTLATLTIGGHQRKVLMQAPKNGFFYVLDRQTGELLSAQPFAKVAWAERIDRTTGRPVEVPAARFPDGNSFELWPGSQGAHSWLPMSYSPVTQLVYLPVMNAGLRFSDKGIDLRAWNPDNPNTRGLNIAFLEGSQATSELVAWNPAEQRAVWKVPTPGHAGGGTMATAANIVFQGRFDGRFVAYDARSGAVLWSFDAHAPVLAPPISYSVAGRQYVTVLTGISTSFGVGGEQAAAFGWVYATTPRRVLTFAIGGTAVLPPPTDDGRMTPIADEDFRPDPDLAKRGMASFHAQRCMTCHGINAISGGAAPDLRASPIILSEEAFDSVVRQGALASQGMPRFQRLSDGDLSAIRQYLRERARQSRDASPPKG